MVGNQNNSCQIDIHIFSFHHEAKHIGVCVFLANQGRILPLNGGHNILKKQEFLAPIHYTLLLHEVLGVKLHAVTKEFLMDFCYLRQCFCYFFTILVVSSNLFFIKFEFVVGSLPLVLNLLWDDCHTSHITKIEK